MTRSQSFGGAFAGKRVLITGHTGFKGSWLSAWLLSLGAEVTGMSLEDMPTSPSHFEVMSLATRMRHITGDVREAAAVKRVVEQQSPDVVFHLAAQSLVRRSYQDPAYTFETNTIGTLNVLEAVRGVPAIRALVLVTSDKAYRNLEWVWGYRENDPLGGEDPYSGSKGAAELVAYSYIHSFFKDVATTAVATARAGNVIGGGDWASDRIVPDCIRAWSSGGTVSVRNAHATRPWQHVLEPLSGYLWLAARLLAGDPVARSASFNFGPDAGVTQSVGDLVGRLRNLAWPEGEWREEPVANAPAEARLLRLSCDKALLELAWRATLDFEETVALTGEWYRAFYAGTDVWDLTTSQIERYEARARARQIAWASGA